MGKGNRNRQIRRRKAEEKLLRQVLGAGEPRFAEILGGPDGDLEMWTLGDGREKTAVMLTRIRDEWPDEIKSAVTARRTASLTGKCDCGSTTAVRVEEDPHPGFAEAGIDRQVHTHENWCPATRIGEIAAKHGWKVIPVMGGAGWTLMPDGWVVMLLGDYEGDPSPVATALPRSAFEGDDWPARVAAGGKERGVTIEVYPVSADPEFELELHEYMKKVPGGLPGMVAMGECPKLAARLRHKA